MKINLMMITALLSLTVVTACKKQTAVTADGLNKDQSNKTATEALADPPATWQEHWFEHVQLLSRVYYDSTLVVYFDSQVDPTIVWPNTYLGQVWNYTKNTYGSFGSDPRLYAIFHTAKYGGGHPSTYMDASHDYRNTIDCGSNGTVAWTAGTGNDLDLTTHEVGHIVEGASKGVHNSPAFGIWHDSKWMEIFIYDVYIGLGRTADAQRWYNLVDPGTESYPRASTRWFRNWFYPIYNQYGGKVVLNNYFTLLGQYFPKRSVVNGTLTITEYTRAMNFGEFVHFWSGAAGVDLKPLALTAFGTLDEQGNDWTLQLDQAKIDFPAINNTNDITGTAALTVSNQNSGGATAGEGSSKLIDGTVDTKFFLGGYVTSFWAQLTFPTAKVVKSYTITSGNDSADRDPKSWNLAGSNDGTTYVQLDTKANEVFATRKLTKVYTITNTTAYKYYKLNVTANNGSSDLQMSEWRVRTN